MTYLNLNPNKCWISLSIHTLDPWVNVQYFLHFHAFLVLTVNSCASQFLPTPPRIAGSTPVNFVDFRDKVRDRGTMLSYWQVGLHPFLGSLPKQNNIIQQPLISGCLGFKECVCKMKQTDLPSFSCEQLKWLWDSWMLTSKMLVSFQPRHKVLRIQLRILVQQKELRGAVHFATFQFKSELYMYQDVPSFWQIPGQIAREMAQICHKLSWERRRTATLSAAPATTAAQLQISVPTHLVAVRPPTSAQHLIADTTDRKTLFTGQGNQKRGPDSALSLLMLLGLIN